MPQQSHDISHGIKYFSYSSGSLSSRSLANAGQKRVSTLDPAAINTCTSVFPPGRGAIIPLRLLQRTHGQTITPSGSRTAATASDSTDKWRRGATQRLRGERERDGAAGERANDSSESFSLSSLVSALCARAACTPVAILWNFSKD